MKNLFKTAIAALLATAVAVLPACNDNNKGNESDPGNPETKTNVAAALAVDDGDEYTLENVLVYAVLEDLLVVGDATGYMIAEVKENVPAVGDRISIKGEVAKSGFYGTKGYSSEAEITVLSSGNDTTLPEPAVLSGEDYDKWIAEKGLTYDSNTSITTQTKPYTVEHVSVVGIYNPSMDYTTGEILGLAVNVGSNPAATPSILEDTALTSVRELFAPYTPDVDLDAGRIVTKKVKITAWAVGAQINPNGGKATLPLLVEAVEAGPRIPRVEVVDNPIMLQSGGTGNDPYRTTIMVMDSEAVPTATCDNPTITVEVDPTGTPGGGDQGMEAYTGYYLLISAPANPSEDNILEATITVTAEGATTNIKVTQDPHIAGEVLNLNIKETLEGVLDPLLETEGVPFMTVIDGETVQRGSCIPLNSERVISIGTTPKGKNITISFQSNSGKLCWYESILGHTGLNVYDSDALVISSNDPSIKIRKVEINGYSDENGDSLTADSGSIAAGADVTVQFSESDIRIISSPTTWVGNAPAVALTTHMTETRLLGVNGIWWLRVTYQE